jgi:hypothetical protein
MNEIPVGHEFGGSDRRGVDGIASIFGAPAAALEELALEQ